MAGGQHYGPPLHRVNELTPKNDVQMLTSDAQPQLCVRLRRVNGRAGARQLAR